MNIMLIGSAGEYGAQLALYSLAKYLKEKDINVLVIVPEKNSILEKYIKAGIPCKVIKNGLCWYAEEKKINHMIKYLGKKIVNCFAEIFTFILIIKYQIDIVHINTIGLSAGARSALLLKRKLIYHIREFVEEDFNRKFYNKKKTLKLVSKSDFIITISKCVYQKYKSLIPDHVDKLLMIYDGVDKSPIARKSEILNEDIITIIFLGRICKEKGQRDLIEAITYMPEACKNKIKATIVGGCTGSEGEMEKAELEKLIIQSGIENIVKFVGYHNNIYELLSSSDISIVASKHEAFGRVTVESMMSGTLVIGTDSGGTPELIGDDRGLLYQYRDSQELAKLIERAIEVPDKMRSMVQKAYTYSIENFTVEKNAEAIIEVYKKAILTKARKGASD